jgi:toxin ParE1/3/4
VYSVTIEPSARLDIAQHYAYLTVHAHSAEYPEVWFDNIDAAILGLSDFPMRFGIAPETREFGEEIRHCIVGSYRVLFTVRDDHVSVIHVRHARQDVFRPDT